MKTRPDNRVEKWRVLTGEYASPEGATWGAFVRAAEHGRAMKIISSGTDDGNGWEHVSVSLPHRCPTWEEMDFVARLFWGDEETVLQFHPPRSKHVNFHPYCLHMWKRAGATVELPPQILVGPVEAA